MLGSCFAPFVVPGNFISNCTRSLFVPRSPASSWVDSSLLKWLAQSVSGSAWPLLSHMLHKHRNLTYGLSLFWEKTPENHGTPRKNVSCANATCLGALITGHSKFFLSQGSVAKRDDTRCAAMQSFEKHACSAGFWAVCFLSAFAVACNFYLKVFEPFFS